MTKQHKLTDDPALEIDIYNLVFSYTGCSESCAEQAASAIMSHLHQASIPTEATGDDVEQVRDVLRQSRPYVADTLSSLSMPSQHREIEKVKSLLIQIDATLSPNRVSQSVVERAGLPVGPQYIDEEALSRWREGCSDGHAMVANQNTVWRLVATIDYYRAALATQPATDTRIPINEEATVSDPWQKGVKLRWVRQLDQRPLAVIGLDTVTIASRFAPLSVTLKECPGVFPLGWFDLADGVVERFIEELERSAGVQGVHIDSDDCAQMAASLRTALEQSQKRERELREAIQLRISELEGDRRNFGHLFREDRRELDVLRRIRKSINRVSDDQGGSNE